MRWLWKDWPAQVKTGAGSEQLQQILLPGEEWKPIAAVPADSQHAPDQATRVDGAKFVTEPPDKNGDGGKVWFISANGEKKVIDDDAKSPGGVTLSPDQSLLYVNDSRSHWVYSYQIQPDGSLQFKQRFYDLFAPDSADGTAAGGMCVDRDGRLYVATRSGVQVCDQAGRVVAIIPAPGGQVSNVSISGNTLFATCGDKAFARQVKVKGCSPSEPPIKPAPPKL